MKKYMLFIVTTMLLIGGCGSGDLKTKYLDTTGKSVKPFLISNLTPTLFTFPSGTTSANPYSFQADGVRGNLRTESIVIYNGNPIMTFNSYSILPLAGRWDVSVEGDLNINGASLTSGATGTITIQMFLTGPTETSNIISSRFRVL